MVETSAEPQQRTRLRKTRIEQLTAVESARVATYLGHELQTGRMRRRLTQQVLGDRTSVSQGEISNLERGQGARAPLELWIAMGVALDRPLRIEFARDPLEEPVDAGHLAIQELVLRLGRAAGYQGAFELPTRPASPRVSAAICLRNDRLRRLCLVEVWNVLNDIGAGARSSTRKLAEGEELAVSIGQGEPYRVSGCWVLRATRRNRELLARYPEVFASRFPGSTRLWVKALTSGSEPPMNRGSSWPP